MSNDMSPVPMETELGEEEEEMEFGEEEKEAAVEEEERFGPAWLLSLLSARFFIPCPAHPGQPKNECNLYCLGCAGLGAICSMCLSDHHHGHHVVQIRRSSYHEVIRVTELEKVVDVSQVQTYVINNDKVVFLNRRQQAPRRGKCIAAVSECVECGRGLLDAAFRFCSLGCKLDGACSDPNVTFAVDPKSSLESGEGFGSADGSRCLTKRQKTGRSEVSSSASAAAATAPIISYRHRQRKGVPERAPFF